MQLIYSTLFGSRLYGTNLPDSDYDVKGVFLPSADEILLGRPPGNWTAPAESGVDSEAYSLSRFLELLAQGQTVALDMFFAPAENWKQIDPIWYDVMRAAPSILNKRCGAAIGYARAQAEKYSLRGSRITALETVLDILKGAKPRDSLQQALLEGGFNISQLPPAAKKYVVLPDVNDDSGFGFLEVCGKKVGLNCSVQLAVQVFSKLLGAYGERSHEAKLGGADWKALYHAVRVTEQTIELLETGHITFPRPNAADLLRIRKGDYTPAAVYERIEQGVLDINAAQAVSELPDEPDRDFINNLVIKIHREIITA